MYFQGFPFYSQCGFLYKAAVMWLPSIISEWKVRKAKKDPFASHLLENRLHSDVRDPEPKREGKKK